jgi:hypothetical protein
MNEKKNENIDKLKNLFVEFLALRDNINID